VKDADAFSNEAQANPRLNVALLTLARQRAWTPVIRVEVNFEKFLDSRPRGPSAM
jgi:hypothetical protein